MGAEAVMSPEDGRGDGMLVWSVEELPQGCDSDSVCCRGGTEARGGERRRHWSSITRRSARRTARELAAGMRGVREVLKRGGRKREVERMFTCPWFHDRDPSLCE